VVRGISGDGTTFVFRPRRDAAVIQLPLRNFEPRYAYRPQTRAHVIRHSGEVLADDARLARFFQHRSEVIFAFLLIRFAIVRGRIIPRMEMRRSTSGSLEHLVPFQRKKFLVPPRTPGKGIDAVEAEHVIDAKKMEAAPDAADTLPPPIEIPATHHVPV